MRSPEQHGTPPNPEREGPAYHQAARFAGEADAGQAYQQAQQTLYASREELDLSAYRFQLDQVSHVAVLGEVPPTEIEAQIRQILSTGEPAELPAPVLRQLHQRRIEQSKLAPWVERHHRPGKRLT